MRTSIACAWCRRSKVKCRHNGTAPCQACIKNSRTCVLSGPHMGRFRPYKSTASVIEANPRTEIQTVQAVPAVQTAIAMTPATSESLLTPLPMKVSIRNQDDDPLSGIPEAIMIEGCRIFVKKFPEFAFIHTPTFFEDLRQGKYHRLKVCAILALCAKFLPNLTTHGRTAIEVGEICAQFVGRELVSESFRKANIDAIQCLLIISLYDWGRCSIHQAWMYAGMAIRMVQILRFEQSIKGPVENNKPLQLEIQNRTIWSCYLMDQLLSSGKHRPVTFCKDDMDITLPISEDEFIFTDFSGPKLTISQAFSAGDKFLQRPFDSYFSLVLQGVDIWAELSKWVGEGGRRATHGREDCPWKPHSPWGRINQRLQEWRVQQGPRIRYPPARPEAHLQRGHESSFALINLIYYLCQIFLHREMVPFFPVSVPGPQGPIESPFFQSTPPLGWWDRSAETLFKAAECITTILSTLTQAETPLMTPFVGFCAFSAGTMNCYLEAFPYMSPLGKTGAKERLQEDIAYLQEFAKLWKIGEGWHSAILKLHRLWTQAKLYRQMFSEKSRDDYQKLEDSMQQYGSIWSSEDAAVEAIQTLVHMPSSTLDNTDDKKSSIVAYSEADTIPLESLDAFFSEENWDTWNWIGENSLNSHHHLMSFVTGQELCMPETFEDFLSGNHN